MEECKMKQIHSMLMIAALLVASVVMTGCKDNDGDSGRSDKGIVVPNYQVVLDFFKEVNAVPRPSKHEEKMREYLTHFAATRGLSCSEHDGNILIRKDATKGMENVPSVVLQTHMDMACVAAEGYNIDFLTEGIESETSDGYIHSKDFKTTLGADNGIGLSIVLAILDSKEIVHGPLECLFTWDEEQGMSGASSLKPGVLKSKYMLNIDSEEDGYLLVGTAGGVNVNIHKAYTLDPLPTGYASFQINVNGLAGGHSGVMINNGGANANKLIADFLNDVSVDYRLVSFEGGTVPNAITESATAIVLVPFDDIETFMSDFNTYMNDAKEKYKDVDVDMSCDEHPLLGTNHCIPQAAADLLISGVSASPQGVLEWSKVVEGIFEVSSNIGVVLTEDDGWFVRELPRSFTDSKIDAVAQQIAGCFEGAEVELENRYSPWSPDITSPLIVYSQKVYQDINGKPIELFIVGGGVEASAFSVTYPDMQIVCYGPTILDAHTINERVEIATIETCWRYTIYLLGQMAECK